MFFQVERRLAKTKTSILIKDPINIREQTFPGVITFLEDIKNPTIIQNFTNNGLSFKANVLIAATFIIKFIITSISAFMLGQQKVVKVQLLRRTVDEETRIEIKENKLNNFNV